MVRLEDTLPAGVAYIISNMSNGGNCTYSSDDVTCNLLSLDAGASVTGTILVTTPLSPAFITNTAWVGSNTVDPNLENNAVSTVTPVGRIHRVYLPLILRYG